jgi:hypothetical protein
MNKSPLVIAALLTALGGSAYAQAPAKAPAPAATSADPIVQMHTEEKAANAAYKEKKKALDTERNAKVTAATDAAAKEATAQGKDPLVAKREASKKVKSETKADYDAKVKAADKERKDALAAIKKKYASATKS